LIAKYTPAVSPTVQNGDTFPEVSGGWQHKRGAVVLGTYLRKNMTRTELTAAFFINGSTAFAFYREEHMPGINVSMTRVRENQTSGAVTFDFSDGNGIEYANWAAVGEMADTIDTDVTLAEKVLAAKAFRASPDGANKATQVGASISINCLADSPVVYTEPE
jgi:hypothetical protein